MNTTQVICDIYSRFLFEDSVFNACEDRFLMPEDLKAKDAGCPEKAYGDGLDPEYMHPIYVGMQRTLLFRSIELL